MKKKLVIPCLICAAMTASAYAADDGYQVEYDRETKIVSISGNAISVVEGEVVTFVILKPGTDMEKLESGETTFYETGIAAGDALVENGAVVFEDIKLVENIDPGVYILRISEKGSITEKYLGIATEDQAIELIKDAVKSEEVIELISTFNDIYSLDMDENSLYVECGEAGQKFIGSYVADADPDDVDELQEAFNQAGCLYKIYLGPWTGVKSVIEDNADILGLSLSDLDDVKDKDKVYKALTGKKLDSVAELEDAFEAAIKANTKKSSSSSSGGSSGGGGGSRPAITTPYTPITSIPAATVSPVETPAPIEREVFTDIDAYDWAEESIMKLYNAGIVNGKQEGIFAPADNVTRAEAVKMLALTFGFDSADETVIFEDVPVDDWAYTHVAAAAKAEVVKGYSDTIFGRDDNITRQDLSVMIYRAALKKGMEFNTADIEFNDSEEIADYAKEAVSALAGAGVINGIDGAFVPGGYATRAQTAKLLAGFVK